MKEARSVFRESDFSRGHHDLSFAGTACRILLAEEEGEQVDLEVKFGDRAEEKLWRLD